ncbi:FISUMP domain-containing protein [Aureispira anguillae]|uniref:Fibrobacter succinogenes major paralogous domain-containing protein n=1 Tax=Aureispira anguillae TaxID=2864201 RepID=A0A916DVV7_9BACT|nr:FISUMP domain-containing protein [Aureispira anguillae]BDS15549.1 hypothetical protein AsAng_0063330 [Aureispira anguillae]
MRRLFVTLFLLGFVASLWIGCDKEEPKLCTASFIDERDGTEYCMVNIGTQTWMAENLNYQSDSAYQNPSNPSTINAVYGKLYPFSEANKVCPNGWHLPTDDEWKTLEINLGMSVTAANGLNERGTDEGSGLKSIEGWDSSAVASVEGTNAVGFNALPAGYRNPSYGPYFDLGETANFWTATVYDTTGGAWMRTMSYDKAGIIRNYATQKMGFSCRCVKN